MIHICMFCSFCRYLEYRNRSAEVSSVIGKRVISMTLGDGRNASYIWGVIRNAQLLPVFFPGWIMRIYVNVNLTAPRILARLSSFGKAIELVRVNRTISTRFSPEWWSLLVADDTSLDYFVVRSPMGRLDDRDFDAVSEWIKASGDNSYLAVHCLRDHKSHSNKPMVDGLWGGRPNVIQSLIKRSIMSLAESHIPRNSDKPDVQSFLSDTLWPLVSNSSLSHDSVSCEKWPRSFAFPDVHEKRHFLGEQFNRHQESLFVENNEGNPTAASASQCQKWSGRAV